MKKTIAVLLAALLFATAAAAQQKPGQMTKKDDQQSDQQSGKEKKPPYWIGPYVKKPGTTPEDMVPSKELMQATWNSWCTLDATVAGRFYVRNDPKLLFFDIAPLKYTGWAEYQSGSAQLLSTLTACKVTINDDAEIHKVGLRNAWAAATLHAELTGKDGKVQQMDLRWTVIWEKRAGVWLIVHEHASAPLPPEAGKP